MLKLLINAAQNLANIQKFTQICEILSDSVAASIKKKTMASQLSRLLVSGVKISRNSCATFCYENLLLKMNPRSQLLIMQAELDKVKS